MGYGGAWVGGMSLVWPLRARHVTLLALLARPTPGFKHTPMGPRPGMVAWAFSANPRPNPSPIPHGLTSLERLQHFPYIYIPPFIYNCMKKLYLFKNYSENI
ncbi:hypothetical protein Hanom_Chr06g00487361 [Helianthus anomalus]